MHTCESIAELVEEHLRSTGKTQVALEAETGITDTHIGRIRSGALPGKWTVAPLAKALGLPVEELTALVARERSRRVVGRAGHRGSRACPRRSARGRS